MKQVMEAEHRGVDIDLQPKKEASWTLQDQIKVMNAKRKSALN